MTRNAIHAVMLLILMGLASIVPWADAQQKPSNVLIWCQNTNGTSSPCLSGNSLDYDSGAGTVNQGTVGIALPASGGPVAGGTSTNPVRIDPTGTTTQPVSGTVTANAGTNLNTSSLLTTTAHDAAFGTAGTADSQVRTIQGIASMTPVQVSQSGTWNIGTVTTLPALPANQSVNVAQINGVTPLMGNGVSGTGVQRVTIASDSTGTVAVTQPTGTNLHVVCDSGCSSSSGFADNGAFTFGTTAINPIGGVLDDTSTNAATENSAAVARITAQKALHMNLRNVSGTEVGTSGAPLRVDPTGSTTQPISGTVTANAGTGNFSVQGAAASGASKAGNPLQMGGVFNTTPPTVTSGQAVEAQFTARGEQHTILRDAAGNLRGANVNASNQLSVSLDGSTATNISTNTAQMNGVTVSMGNGVSGTGVQRVTLASDSTGQVALAAGSNTIGNVGALPVTSGGTSVCYLTSGASNNATNCKNAAGQLYGYDLINTTTTIYYLRIYNLSASPTCSSATGFVRTIPIPPASAAGGAGGIARSLAVGEAYGTGLGFCLTGGGSSTDNTNAATGVYVTLNYK